MRTMATTALLLGFFLVGAAPAAFADSDGRGSYHDERGSFQDERSSFHGDRDSSRDEHGSFRGDRDSSRDERGSFRGDRDDFRSAHRGGSFRDDTRKVRALAFELDRATDELARDARRAAGRIDRRDVAALRAVRRLESAADHLRHELAEGRVFDRHARRDFAQVQRSYRQALHQLDAFGFSRELRASARRVDRLLVALDQALDERFERLAWQARHPARVAWR